MSTNETPLEAAKSQSESETVRKFLLVSGAYLFNWTYRDSLRAAYARRALQDSDGRALVLSWNCNAAPLH